MASKLRVLVTEDSPTDRALLVGILESDPQIEVVGKATNGAEAVKLAVRLRPDVITMDIRMPVMDGLEATRAIMNQAPAPIVVVSSMASRDVDLAAAANGAGALLVMEKPAGPHSPAFDEQREKFLGTVKSMAQVKVVRRWTTPVQPVLRAPVEGPEAAAGSVRLIAIGASTGGPAALHRVLKPLPRAFPAPMLVVQHIAHGFIGGLAHWLSSECGVHVKVASSGEQMKPGTVYLAPDDYHIGCNADHTVLLSKSPSIGGFRPSATYLFESAARSYAGAVAAVILTGMGSDGVAGLAAVSAAGGQVIAQDQASSVVYGMPQEAVRTGLANAILPPDEIAERLMELVYGGVDARSNSDC